MILEIAKWVVIIFGIFIIFAGFVMLFAPKKARITLRKAGSSNLINYSEITIRLIPAIALILHADYSKFPIAFSVFGWVMLITSLILYVVPRKIHHKFSMKSADILKPLYFQLISPFAFLFGALIIYTAI
ncbi:hypothetical protein [Ulvibacter antarcticus]|uniref:Uncharacterized protein n=1 Tax=Ulvibacter antarcticus TaxID=442714 RepID=A0A3L9Z391_9FLAO|nr:hypothetical protein [Ulvibacter antarcticus]RMA64808.1 hypothetical protein BXY75_1690 [Ulvibacter antarcticus]